MLLICKEIMWTQRHAGYTSPHHLDSASIMANLPADRLPRHPSLACALPPLFLFCLPLVRPQTVSPLHPMADSCLHSVIKEPEHTKSLPCRGSRIWQKVQMITPENLCTAVTLAYCFEFSCYLLGGCDTLLHLLPLVLKCFILGLFCFQQDMCQRLDWL